MSYNRHGPYCSVCVSNQLVDRNQMCVLFVNFDTSTSLSSKNEPIQDKFTFE